MLVARREIENLDELHRRGNVVTEIYLDRRKKLVTDFYSHKNQLLEISLPALIEVAPAADRSRLRAMGQALRESKEFLVPLMNLVSAMIGLFGK
jgi:electron transfer flavoprotein alpha/beta subunit